MTQENTGQTETEFERGYDDRWRDVPYREMPANHGSGVGKKPTLSCGETTQ
jgi:hypothetical protein